MTTKTYVHIQDLDSITRGLDATDTGVDTGLEETRAEALFASDLQRSEPVTPESVREAVTATVRRLGTRGCAARVAHEFGEYPETAVGRMRWALVAVRQAYALG
jgi:hypothetical protein